MRWSASALLAVLLISGCEKGCFPIDRARFQVIDEAVDAPNESMRNSVLRGHGPIRPNEVTYLIDQTGSWTQRRRHNAAEMLVRANSQPARDHLRHLVRTTKEPELWRIAMRALIAEPDAQELAAAQPQQIDKALAVDDEYVIEVGLSAAILSKRPGAYELVGRMLEGEDKQQKIGALGALVMVGPGPLAPRLRELATAQQRGNQIPEDRLLRALLHSDDPTLAPLFAETLIILERDMMGRILFSSSLRQPRLRKPWLRDLLLTWAQQPAASWVVAKKLEWMREAKLIGHGLEEPPKEAQMKLAAVSMLREWGPEVEKPLLTSCAETLEAIPTGDEKERRRFFSEVDPCLRYLGELAGRKPYAMEEAEVKAALDFAKTRLADSP